LEIDKDVVDFLIEHADESQHIIQIFTKIDKLNQKEQNALRKHFPNALMVSSSKKKGLHKVIDIIHEVLQDESDED
jgi:GTP-binding protein